MMKMSFQYSKQRHTCRLLYHNLRRSSFFIDTNSNLQNPLTWTLKSCAPKVDRAMSRLL